jgi:hypothetical protein
MPSRAIRWAAAVVATAFLTASIVAASASASASAAAGQAPPRSAGVHAPRRASAHCTKARRGHRHTCHAAKKKKRRKKHKTTHVVLGPGSTIQSVTAWKQDASPVGWSAALNRIIYSSRGANGLFNAYSAGPDGSDPQCLTCAIPTFPVVGAATNRGVSDVSPDGRYMLVTVERGNHGGRIGAAWTQPGKGGANDVWLYTTDGAHAWPLTNITAAGQQAIGTIWPRFDRTGNEIVWASMYSPALLNLGYWQLKVANIVWTGGVPSLANVRAIQPPGNAFYEPYGFSPDDSHILFASNAGTPFWYDTQIDSVATGGSGLTRLTQPATGAPLRYNEFAFYTPADAIIYGSTLDATSGGLDYWIMNPDGTDQRRLTYFNSPWNTEYLGYSIVAGLVFNPANPNQFLASVAGDKTGENVNALMVNLNPFSGLAGLTEKFYSGQSFGQLVASTLGNPSDGFDADASPAPGVPATNYSVRWTGAVTPPASGSYGFCLFANTAGQLLIDGHNAVNTSGRRECATVTTGAGRPIAIEMDYEHARGPAFAQLSWIPPGASSPTLIPTSALSATAP